MINASELTCLTKKYVCIVYFHLVHITIKGLRIDVLRNIVNKVSILNRYWENSDEVLLPEP